MSLEDAKRQRARACTRHTAAAVEGLVGVCVVWGGTHGVNEYEVTALRIAEERSQLSRKGALA